MMIFERNGSYYPIYNPFNREEMEEMKLDLVAITLDESTTIASKLYRDTSNGLIIWSMMVIQTDVDTFFNKRIFPRWIKTLEYRKDEKGFCKDVAHVIRNYPHVECNLYGRYIKAFMRWMRLFESSHETLKNILDEIMDNLKWVYTKERWIKFKTVEELNENIDSKSTILPIEDCSNRFMGIFRRERDTFLRIIERVKRAIEEEEEEECQDDDDEE